MSKLTSCLVTLFVCACSLAALPIAQATIIMHSDVSGATVDFTNISEGSTTSDPEPLFGQPFASGDNLIFPTTANFAASSSGGGLADQTAGKVWFIMSAKSGYSISTFSYSEGGYTTLNDPFDVGDAYSQVVAFAAVQVLEINNVPVSLPSQQFMAVSPNGGQYLLSSLGGTTYATGWSGTLSLPLPAGTTKALVTLDNSLFAASMGTGTQAYIDKTSFGVDIDSVVIPEPSTVLLTAGAMLAWSLSTFRRPARD